MIKNAKQAAVGISKAQYTTLNEEFYSRANPSRYFDARLRVLIALINEEPGIRREINEDFPGVPSVETDIADDEFLAIEATNLFHHTAECLWRLIIIFTDAPECPQLELTLLLEKVMSTVKERLDEPKEKRLRRIERVFGLGAEIADENGDVVDVSEHLEAIERLTTAIGRKLLDDAQLYNSAKHGMGISTGSETVSFVPRAEGDVYQPSNDELLGRDPLISTSGVWITHFDTILHEGRGFKFARAKKLVDVVEMLRLIAICNQLIRLLWTITKGHYLGEEVTPIDLPSKADADGVLRHDKERITAVFHDLTYDNDDKVIIRFACENAIDLRRFVDQNSPRAESEEPDES